jgi:hypothetical protein
MDGVQNNNETDVDCGGGVCAACAVGKKCKVDADCVSMACDANTLTCVPNECNDHQQDGQETDVDCGGPICAGCAAGKKCMVNSDCVTMCCDANTKLCFWDCGCIDHVQDGLETDIDCGGPICAPCAVGKKCLADTDCTTNACDAISLICVTNQCMDHRKDGAETDIDCGGGTCAPCAIGKQCLVDADCTDHACDAITHVCT